MSEELSIQGTLAETTVPDLFRSLIRSSETAVVSLEGLGRTDEAIATYKTAILWQKDLLNQDPGPFINLGALLLDENQPKQAISYLAQAVSIAANGTISATVPGETQAVELGKLQVATFANPAGLAAQGSTLFKETSASGTAVLGAPGEGGAGAIRQGMLEVSNVNVVEEMIDLISGQRAYEVNSRVIKAADDMLGETAQLR